MDSLRRSMRLLEKEHWFLLWVLGAAAFFEGYDLNIVSVALPQLRHSFSLSRGEASLWVALLFLGALPAVVLTRRADRHGRRRVLLVSVVGYTLCTAATAAAPGIALFAVCQFGARLFLGTENAVVWTMVTEELPAGARGFGFGWLSMLAAVGTGASAVLYGAVLSPLGLSWRWLYVLALPPLIGIALLRRRLPESRRFESARADGRLAPQWRQITRPPHRRWLVLLSASALLAALTTHAAVFVVDFLENTRHVGSGTAQLLVVAAGAPAVVVLLVAGSWSDRYGRKLIGCSFSVVAVVGALSFFFVARGRPALFACMAVTYIGTFGAGPALGAFATELFPTPLRALGGSTVSVARVVGQALSLGLGALLLHVLGSLPDTVAVLVLGPLAMIVIVAVWFPETHGRELEELHPEEVSLPAGGVLLPPAVE